MAFSSIDKPSKYFDTKLYTGDGTTNQTITGINFKPDFNWIELRSSAHQHTLTDAVRGLNKGLLSNSTSAETTDYQYGWLSSFNSDGFTTQKGSGIAYNVNQSGETYVSWNWLGANTTASNNSGTITSTVSANTTSGFSIVSYTGTATAGATVGHGLGVVPSMIITKARTIADNWGVYHKSLGATKALYLNTTNAEITSSAYYNNTAPSSTVVTLGDNEATNDNAGMIMYAFAEIKGYSKAFSYTGNGSTDGTFVYTGFKPAFVMIKRTDSAFGWYIYDSVRDPENQNTKALLPAESDAEQNESGLDLLSSGFKLRNTDGSKNASGGTYIGIAFASNPFVSSKGIPTCAF